MAIFKQPNVSELVNKWCRPTQRPCRVILSPAQGQLLGLSHRLPQKQPKTQFWQFLAETKKWYSHSFMYEKGPLGTFAGAKKIKKKRRATTLWPRACWSHFGPFRVLTTPSVHRVKVFFAQIYKQSTFYQGKLPKIWLKKSPGHFKPYSVLS